MERCQAWKAALWEHAWPGELQGGILYSKLHCGLSVVWEECSQLLKTQIFVPKTQLMNLQHRTEPVSYTEMPFVWAFD